MRQRILALSLALLLTGCGARESTPPPSPAQPEQTLPVPEASSPEADSAPQGTTEVFTWYDFSAEVTHVKEIRTEQMLSEGIEWVDYTVFTCYPGAELTVLKPGLSDPAWAEDGKAHPQWGIYYTGEPERTRITEETGTLPVTAETEGIYSLESSVFVLKLEVEDPAAMAILEEQFPRDLLFASGAGAWGTVLTLNADGTFTGQYHDSDMGDNAPEYPHGTVYLSNFSGRFCSPVLREDGSISLRLDSLTYEAPLLGEERIENQQRFIASDAYGVAGGETFLLYPPGTAAEGLSEDFLSWWPDAYLWRQGEVDVISGWSLYNTATGDGFFTTWLE